MAEEIKSLEELNSVVEGTPAEVQANVAIWGDLAGRIDLDWLHERYVDK